MAQQAEEGARGNGRGHRVILPSKVNMTAAADHYPPSVSGKPGVILIYCFVRKEVVAVSERLDDAPEAPRINKRVLYGPVAADQGLRVGNPGATPRTMKIRGRTLVTGCFDESKH